MPAAILGIAKGAIGGHAAGQAAGAAQDATDNSLNFNNGVWNKVQGNYDPFIGYGQNAGGILNGLFTGDSGAFHDFLNSTNYGFTLDQGLKGQSYLNAPNLFSGATSKALTNYAQGQAGNALQGYMTGLLGQEGIGVNAANGEANAGLGIAGLNQGAQFQNAGAQGWADMYKAGSVNNALSGLTNGLGSSSFGGGNALAGLFGGSGTAASAGSSLAGLF